MQSIGNDGEGSNKTPWWKRGPVWIPVLAAVTGGLMGGPGYRALDNPREDPVRGREMEAMEARLVNKIESGDYQIRIDDRKIENRIDGLDQRVTSLASTVMLLPPDTLLERMTRAEEKIKYLDKACLKWSKHK